MCLIIARIGAIPEPPAIRTKSLAELSMYVKIPCGPSTVTASLILELNRWGANFPSGALFTVNSTSLGFAGEDEKEYALFTSWPSMVRHSMANWPGRKLIGLSSFALNVFVLGVSSLIPVIMPLDSAMASEVIASLL